jgi:hypothetical protein
MIVLEPRAPGEVDGDGSLMIDLRDVVDDVVGEQLIVFVREDSGFLQKVGHNGEDEGWDRAQDEQTVL